MHSPHLSDRRRRYAVRVLGIALAAACSLPVSADWLVTREGHRIETEGPWKVKGRTVVYTAAGGTLSSMRLSEVDLEASEAAGEEPVAPPPAAAPVEKKAPVLVLTNKDIAPATEIGPAARFESTKTLIMYSTDWCGYCRKARALFAELGADYIEKDIDKSAEARREYLAKFGSKVSVPRFDYDGEKLTGWNPATLRKWVAEMKGQETEAAEAEDS